MNQEEQWMQRALELAEYGRGSVSPNPMVGCVIVHLEAIIGEGWHRKYGGPHAEVWAVEDAVRRGNEHLLSEATVYVTLEPCSHTGKTPPCADLLVRKKVKRVVICNVDNNPLVGGKGIARLRDAGITVECDLLKEAGLELNKRFFKNITDKRPYVILKWAETANGSLSDAHGNPMAISGVLSNVRVHQWRSEEDAILVGFNTAMKDNPRLNVRHWEGKNPVRVVMDRYLQLTDNLHLLDPSQPTIIVNYGRETELPPFPERYSGMENVAYMKIQEGSDEIFQMLSQLTKRGIHSVFVEGGASILRAFIASGFWDEIRRCQSMKIISEGIKAPSATGRIVFSEKVEDDLWTFYRNI